LTIWAAVAPLQAQTELTMLASFDRQPDRLTMEWMEQEAKELFSDAGLTLSWQLVQEISRNPPVR